jgi:hypothetical protein
MEGMNNESHFGLGLPSQVQGHFTSTPLTIRVIRVIGGFKSLFQAESFGWPHN